MNEDTDMQESKPEKARIFLTKMIAGYETQVVNTVNYNDDFEQMYLDAIMLEVHNYDADEESIVLKELKENDFQYLDDGDIHLVIEDYELFTEKQLDKDMILTIKYPAI